MREGCLFLLALLLILGSPGPVFAALPSDDTSRQTAPTPAAYLLIGYTYDANTGNERIVRIDPASGALTTMLEFSINQVLPDAFAIDPTNRRAYLVATFPGAPTYHLMTIQLDTFVITSVPINTGQGGFGFSLAGPGKLAGYDFNPDVHNPAGGPTWRIINVDPATGSVTQVAALASDFNMGVGKFAVNSPAQMAIYSGNKLSAPTHWPLRGCDLQTGGIFDIYVDHVLAADANVLGVQPYPGSKLLAFYGTPGGGAIFHTYDWITHMYTVVASLPAGTFDYLGANQFAVTPDGATAFLAGQAHGESVWRLYQVPLGVSPPAATSVVLGTGGANDPGQPGDGAFGFAIIPAPGAPVVTLQVFPPAVTKNTSADFSFTGSGGLGPYRYAYAIDRGAWSAPSSQASASFTGLGQGSHTFQVKAIDSLDAWSQPVSYTWRVDLMNYLYLPVGRK